MLLSTPPHPNPEATSATPPPGKARVLVVEDNPIALLYSHALLSRAGFEVITAYNGLEAWDALTKDCKPGASIPPLDLLISDWNMPEMDGMELVKRVRAHAVLRSLYVIMVTAKSELNDKLAGLNQGADDFIAKPYQPDELLARVQSGLRIRTLQHELQNAQHRVAAMQLAASAGHEINNPLMVLMGNLDLLKERLEESGKLDADLTKRLSTIFVSAERIRDITMKLKELKTARVCKYVQDTEMIDLRNSQ